MLSLSSSIYFLHLLRNLSPLYYALILIVGCSLILHACTHRSKSFWMVALAILFVITYVSTLSVTTPFGGNPFIGLFRLFLLAPFVLYIFSVKPSSTEDYMFWWIVILFSCLASLSLVFQLFTGPVSWFAESSFGRAGVNRFSSLAGSLTAYGALLPAPIVASALLAKVRPIKYLIILLLLAGAFISLQKMALGTAGLAIMLIAIRSYRSFTLTKSSLFRGAGYSLAAVLVLSLLYNIFSDAPYFQYFMSLLDPSRDAVGDVSMEESIGERLVSLPFAAVNFWARINNDWLGVGVVGAGGGLGYPEFPMPHNIIYETFLVYGFPLSVLILGFLSYVAMLAFVNVIKRTSDLVFVSSACFLLLLLPSIFSGGLLYHPVIGLIFWFSCSRVIGSSSPPWRMLKN